MLLKKALWLLMETQLMLAKLNFLNKRSGVIRTVLITGSLAVAIFIIATAFFLKNTQSSTFEI
jgi:hypothetical protein